MRILGGKGHERILVRTTQGLCSCQPAEHLVRGVRRGGALRSSCLVLSLLIAFTRPGGAWAGTANSAATWMMSAHLATVRAGDTVTTLSGGGILTVGGLDAAHRPTSRAERYDPHTGVWTATGSLHGARAFHTATLLPAGKVLVAGGDGVAGDVSSAELYDPRSGTWETTKHMVVSRVSSTTMPRRIVDVLLVMGVMGQDGLPVQRCVVRPVRKELHGDRPWVGGASSCRDAGRRLEAAC